MTTTDEREVAIDWASVFRRFGYHPHPKQVQVHMAYHTARNRVVVAGRRTGKSVVGGSELAPAALAAYRERNWLAETGHRREYWIVGPEYSDSEKEFRVAYNALSRLGVPFDKPGTYNDPVNQNMHISLWNGALHISGKSARHPDTLVGEGLSGVILAEAAKLKQNVWTKFIRPTLADFQGWALFSTTPEGRNWVYDLWRDGQNPAMLDWWSCRMPSWSNPYVYPKGATDEGLNFLRSLLNSNMPLTSEVIESSGVDPEIASLLGDLTPEAFNQEIGADFSEYVGRVFKEWDEEVHVKDLTFNPAWRTYAAVDYGFTNPNVWLLIQTDPFGERIHILDEVYEPGLTPEEFAHTIAARGLAPRGMLGFYPDPASPGDTRTLEKILRVRGRGHTGGEIAPRIRAIRDALRPWPRHLPADHPDKFPRLLIDRKCIHTISDFGAYRYPQTRSENAPAPENPMKVDDHAPEALGRFFAGIAAPSEDRPTVSRANFTSPRAR